jgi:hypothetical protein
VKKAGETGEWATHPKSEGDDAHMLDRGIGEQPLDVAPAVKHEGREDKRRQTHCDHQRTWRDCFRVHGKQKLEP